jgi:hypothetical protein
MRRLLPLGLISALAAGACSLVNAPDDVRPGTGGQTSSSSGGGMCHVDGDCPTSDVPCTRYACALGGSCQLVTLADGTSCDDGHACTIHDTCEQGKCAGAPRLCPAQDTCNVGSCDEKTDACIIVPAGPGTVCDDGDPCTGDGACLAGACQKGPDACALLATDCTDAMCQPGVGCMTQNKLDGTFCGQSSCSNGQCAAGHCAIQAINEGMTCDDGQFCTIGDSCRMGHCIGDARVCPTSVSCSTGTCDEAGGKCVETPIPDKGLCDDGDACTAGEFCNNQTCGGGLPPSTYFFETFATGGPGWTKDQEWAIGAASPSFGGHDGDDPGADWTGDDQVAGVELGGLAFVADPDPTHAAYYLTSPSFNTNFAGAVYLTFRRWLNTDYQPYMRDTVEVSNDDGATWNVVWENAFDIPINEDAWSFQSLEITPYKGPKTRVRWGFSINSAGVYAEGSWNLDAVKVQNAPCPQ